MYVNVAERWAHRTNSSREAWHAAWLRLIIPTPNATQHSSDGRRSRNRTRRQDESSPVKIMRTDFLYSGAT